MQRIFSFLLACALVLNTLASDSLSLQKRLDSARSQLENIENDDELIVHHLFLAALHTDLNDVDGAKSDLEQAYQKAISKNDKALQSRIVMKIGDLLSTDLQFQEALNYYRRGLLIEKERKNPDGIFDFHNKIGGAHLGAFEYSEAHDAYNKALLVGQVTEKEIKHSQTYSAIANLFRTNLGKPSEAILYYKRALELYKQNSDSSNIAWTLNRIGNCNIDLGNYDVAYTYYQNAFDIQKKLESPIGQVAGFNNIGEIFRFYGNYSSALENYVNALQIAKETSDDRSMAILLNNIGIIYYLQHTSNLALEYFDKSLEYSANINFKESAIESYNYMGKTFQDRGETAQALEYFQKSIDLADELGDMIGEGEALSSRGDLYYEKKDYRQALKNFGTALTLARKIDDKKGSVVASIGAAKVRIDIGETVPAMIQLNKALITAKELGVKPQVAEIYRLLSQANENLSRYSRSLEYYKKYTMLDDSLQSSRVSQQIEVIQQQYEAEQREKEVEYLKQERALQEIEIEKNSAKIKEQQLRQTITGVGLVLVIIAAIAGWFAFNERKKAFQTLEVQTREIAEKNKSITDSIQYAKRIQSAFLTSKEYLQKVMPRHFIYYKPKDIVSGDFYWAYQNHEGKAIVAAVDCTGHGVPGAFMSMIGMSLLNEIVMEHRLNHSEQILEELRNGVILSLKQNREEGEDSTDGMDISLIVWDKKTNELEFSGANNPLLVVRNNELIEIKGDKQPIGIYAGMSKPFTRNNFKLEKNDMIYLLTDGYADQFGEKTNKKFKTHNLKDFLVSIGEKPFDEQYALLEDNFENWKGTQDQLDDICVIGIRVT